MKLISLSLISKNNVKTGRYIYHPVVQIGEQYFYCDSIITNKVIRKSDIDIDTLIVKRQIQPKFYAANGINTNNEYEKIDLDILYHYDIQDAK